MFRVVLLFCAYLIIISSASCPHMNRILQQANQIYQNDLENAKLALQDDITILWPQPGWPLGVQGKLPCNVINAENKISMLVLAEQYYAQQYLMKIGQPKLTSEQITSQIEALSSCVPLKDRCLPIPECSCIEKYRTITGICNNLQYPNLGSAMTQYIRLLPAAYEDGLYEIKRNIVTGQRMASPRVIANAIYKNKNYITKPKLILNMGGLTYGQMVVNDISHLQQFGINGKSSRCCYQDYTNILPKELSAIRCDPIEILKTDPFYSQYNMTCMNFVRSHLVLPNDCLLNGAQQLNGHSSYMDGSSLYGNSKQTINKLRSFKDGKMKIDKQNMLYKLPNCNDSNCYVFADPRTVGTPLLLFQASALTRLHNYLAGQLKKLNRHWNDEQLFQEAKRILLAIYQNVFLIDWLRVIIGQKEYNKHFACTTGYCGSYDESINPGTLSEIVSSVLRYFHALFPNEYDFYSNATTIYESITVSDGVDKPNLLTSDYDGILRGSLFQQINFDGYGSQLRNHLFKGSTEAGIDLGSYDIARSRDFGLSPYYKYVENCALNHVKINSWEDLEFVISTKNLELLQSVYDSVHDVEMGPGLYLEIKDEYLGFVGKCIIVQQFKRLMNGDRFFYRFGNSANPFTTAQLNEIYKMNFARVLCQVTNAEEVPENAFVTPSNDNKLVKCEDIQNIDLSLWKE